MADSPSPATALVLGGGGARAAYQAGLLRGLARHLPDLRFPIITGVSAGGINAAFLAAHPGNLRDAAEDLVALWSDLTLEQVFCVDSGRLGFNLLRWAARLISGGSRVAPRTRGLPSCGATCPIAAARSSAFGRTWRTAVSTPSR